MLENLTPITAEQPYPTLRSSEENTKSPESQIPMFSEDGQFNPKNHNDQHVFLTRLLTAIHNALTCPPTADFYANVYTWRMYDYTYEYENQLQITISVNGENRKCASISYIIDVDRTMWKTPPIFHITDQYFVSWNTHLHIVERCTMNGVSLNQEQYVTLYNRMIDMINHGTLIQGNQTNQQTSAIIL